MSTDRNDAGDQPTTPIPRTRGDDPTQIVDTSGALQGTEPEPRTEALPTDAPTRALPLEPPTQALPTDPPRTQALPTDAPRTEALPTGMPRTQALPTSGPTSAAPTGGATSALPTGGAASEPPIARTSAMPAGGSREPFGGAREPLGGSSEPLLGAATSTAPAATTTVTEDRPPRPDPVDTAGATAAAAPQRPVSRTLRVGTVVWGLIIAIIGVGFIAIAAGARFDVELVLIGLLALAGVALVAGSVAVGMRRRR